MQIIHDFLTENEYSRPGKRLQKVLAIVIHWTANPGATAKQNRDYFESKKTGMSGYASAHYIIDQNGIIVAAIPENEVAYHCGSSDKDPASGKVYTDEARRRFGYYASESSSPNNCTLGVELCPTDVRGNFTNATINAAVELCADICKRYGLTTQEITTHHNIVGWKDCPKLWTKRPELLDAFKLSVKDYMTREC
jgi:N-acetylmuramoyl-L-alanine amidase